MHNICQKAMKLVITRVVLIIRAVFPLFFLLFCFVFLTMHKFSGNKTPWDVKLPVSSKLSIWVILMLHNIQMKISHACTPTKRLLTKLAFKISIFHIPPSANNFEHSMPCRSCRTREPRFFGRLYLSGFFFLMTFAHI